MIRSTRLLLGFLTFLNLLNYLDRIVLSAVLPKILDDLHLPYVLGGALATTFLVGYFVTSPIFGRLAERRPRRGLMALGIGVWSIGTAATGLATGRAELLSARALVGVGEASFATLAPTVIDDIAPHERRGRYLALFFMMTPVGAALGYLFGGTLGQRYGWRVPFFIAGGPGILLALAYLFTAEPARKLVRERASFKGHVMQLLRIDVYRYAVLGYAAYTFALGGFAHWAPTFLVRTYGMSLGAAGTRFGMCTVLGGVVGTWLGGSFADRRTPPGASDEHAARVNLRVCAVSAAFGAPLAALAFLAPNARVFFVGAFLCEVALFSSTSPINVAILRAVPNELRAGAMALAIFMIHLFGDLWSPLVVGVIADHAPMRLAMMILAVSIALGAVFWSRDVQASAAERV